MATPDRVFLLPWCGFRLTSEAYPLVLNAGRRSIYHAHSQFRDLDCLQRRHPEALAEVHPETAAEHRVNGGETVYVESPRGRIPVKLKVTENVVRGVVCLLHGWSDANANELTDDRRTDPVLASAPLRSGVCRLIKADT